MTFVLGIIVNDTIFISGDTAITTEGNNLSLSVDKSTFGETHYIDDIQETKVEESYLKLFNIANKIIIGFAGDVNVAEDTIKYFKTLLMKNNVYDLENISKCLVDAIVSCESDDPKNFIELLVAFMNGHTAYLLSYKNNRPRTIQINPPNSFSWIGNANTEYAETILKNINNIFHEKLLTNADFQIVLNSLIQSYGIHNYVLPQGIGGTISGVRIDKDGINWQADTTYILYNFSNNEINFTDFISIAFRGNGLFTGNYYNNIFEVRIYTNPNVNILPYNDEGLEEWLNTLNYNYLEALLKYYQSQYYVFINVQNPIILIITKETNDKKGIISFEQQEDLIFKISVNTSIGNLHIRLLSKIRGTSDDPTEYTFHWFN